MEGEQGGRTAAPAAGTDPSGRKHRSPRGAGTRLKDVGLGVGRFLKAVVDEAVGELVLQVLSCLLLLGVGAVLLRGWSVSPVLALGAAALLLFGGVAAFTVWRHPGPGRARRMGVVLFTVVGGLVAWFVMYGSNCGCV
ncbi:hypothetical protein [Streptomyces sp. NPDC052042]|uniref:hypothetical protein n=1 Tax=Streptomyces sp. NPDC052042 TaxID=3365683 RepID=UPI0037D3F13C